MKKTLKIIGLILGLFILALFVIPILFEDEIEAKLKKSINQNLTAKVDWQSLDLSLISHFPKASLDLQQLEIVNKLEFKGDTLIKSGAISLELGVWQLLTSDEIIIDAVEVNQAHINIKVNEDGKANYNITKVEANEKTSTNTDTKDSKPLQLALNSYSISNSSIVYDDASSKMRFSLSDFNHNGEGNLVASTTNLNTHTDAKISFNYDGVDYLSNNSIQLDALLKIDFDKMKFSFLENEALINQLPLNFDGYVQLFDDYQDIAISFSTPNADFKNFMGLIPEAYAGNLNGIETQGEFQLKGEIKGQVTDVKIPTINITGNSNNAHIKYSDLPQPISDIDIDLAVINETGIVEDTYVSINPFSFKIVEDRFSGSLKMSDLTEKMMIDLAANGTLNLANLKQAYPIETDLPMQGILKSNLNGKFSLAEVQNKNYEQVNLNGNLGLNNFIYQDEALPKEITISNAKLKFTTNTASLTNFEMQAGKSDLKATGSLNNLMGFALNDETLKGVLNATSTNFRVGDFMAATESVSKQPSEETSTDYEVANTPETAQLQLPNFLDLTLKFNANKVNYTNFNFKNMSGRMQIKDASVKISDASTEIFGGTLNLDGLFDTKTSQPNFDFKLGFNLVDITESFEAVDLLKSLAPITKALNGNMNFDLNFDGKLTQNFDLVKESLDGNLKATIVKAGVAPEQSKLLSGLNSNFSGIKLDKLNLKDITALLSFTNGQIKTKPFSFNIGDIGVNAQGSHGFDNQLDYQLNLNLPAKYLGDDVGNQLSQLAGKSNENFKVDVPVSISGSHTNPTFNINTKQAINSLKNQIINQQKENLKDKISDKVGDLLGNNKSDSTSTKTEEKVKEVLGGLFGKKKKKN
ncbi:AsmA-like C-terminal region-containing protein [Psychroflexus sp. ALD_RP9]|uniref:AsmA-like C-terminal region-containing protein n=1 Tax=Psychroflexus sp. ALD_RP9 TaxID=2777186 RepID=UPI001A8BF696|nr:AsmA-like C-terminal region-containing protein [Psychroflexus sp. ALD_RP9]QSS97510.1 AsmA family protein [Psychroflexus sp. ALD_RP9]